MSDLKSRILAAVQDDLALIEKELADNLAPHLDLVADVAGHILFAGGKRPGRKGNLSAVRGEFNGV